MSYAHADAYRNTHMFVLINDNNDARPLVRRSKGRTLSDGQDGLVVWMIWIVKEAQGCKIDKERWFGYPTNGGERVVIQGPLSGVNTKFELIF